MEEERKRRDNSAHTRSPKEEGVRLLRIAESLKLSTATLEKIKHKVFGAAFDKSEVKVQTLPAPEPAPARPDVSTVRALAQTPVETKAPAHYPVVERIDPLEAELALRAKVETTQDFAAFKADAWKLFEHYPRPETAARLIELALLYGNALELEEVFISLMRSGVDFYPAVDAETRVHALTKLWQAKRFDFLDQFLFRKDLLLKLIPAERWYCCWSMIDRGQNDQAFRWFKRFESEIWAAQKQLGGIVHKSDHALAVAMGAAALQGEDEAIAIRYLETIPHGAPEFAKALDLLLDVRVEKDDKGFCKFGQRLSRELDWKARLSLFDTFFTTIQRVEHKAAKDRAALNALLADPLRWFPESPEAWQAVSELLVRYAGLERLLPNVLKTLHDRTNQYFKAPFEHALWSPVIDHDFKNPVKTWYWRSVALLHEFAIGLGQSESKLWEARQLYAEAYAHEPKALPHSWTELHRGLTQWIAKSDRLEETQRVKLQLLAKLCSETREVSADDVKAYLAQVEAPSEDVLNTLERLVRDRHQPAVELDILERRASLYHYTNTNIARMWELGAALRRNDLCWRAATLLKSRQALSPELEKHWAISGEKRREFPLLMLTDAHLKKVFSAFDGYERRLIESLVIIGPLIPELLAGLHQALVPIKRSKPLTQNEIEANANLDKMTWITPVKKQFSPNPGGLWTPKPSFFANLLDTKWSVIFIGLANRFGISAWEWQLSLLNQQIESVVPRMSRAADPVNTGKVGRWLRALNPQQRKAWYELAAMVKRFDDDKGQEIISRFLAILTTTMHQDHIGALHNLDRLRAPLKLRWNLERWILSEAYGDIRKSLGAHSVGMFTEDVYKLRPLAAAPVPK